MWPLSELLVWIGHEGVKAIGFVGGGGAVGFIAKAFWDRWFSGVGVSYDVILSDLREKKYVPQGRLRRLRSEARRLLNLLRTKYPNPFEGDPLLLRRGNVICQFLPERNETTNTKVKTVRQTSIYLEILAQAPSNKNDYSNLDLSVDELIQPILEEYGKRLKLFFEENLAPDSIIRLGLTTPNPKDIPVFWIRISRFQICKKEVVHPLGKQLLETTQKFVGPAYLVLELPIPDDLHDSLMGKSAVRSIVDWHRFVDAESEAIRYLAARNLAVGRLREGFSIGSICPQSEVGLTHSLLDSRLAMQDGNGLVTIETARLISISGPPGSGKTELAQRISDLYFKQKGYITIVFKTPHLLDAFSKIHTQPDKVLVMRMILDGIAKDNLITDAGSRDVSIPAFLGALEYAFLNTPERFLLVLDDIQAYSKVLKSAKHLLSNASSWKMKLMVIGRCDFGEAEGDRVSILCNPFSRVEADQILGAWAAKRESSAAIPDTKIRWLAKQNQFSLYMLRIVYRNLQILQTPPRVLLTQQMEELFSKILGEVSGGDGKIDAVSLLSEIRRMVSDGSPSKHILSAIDGKIVADPVRLFGTISWFSRYESEDSFLTPEKVSKWCTLFGIGISQAETLLETGRSNEIFKGSQGFYVWHDPLVADVCAALYFGNEIMSESLSDSAIVSRVQTLDSAASTDFLALALDPKTIIRIIKSIARENPECIGLVGKILTSDVVQMISDQVERTGAIVMELWSQGVKEKTTANQMPIAFALSKFAEADTSVAIRCDDKIRRGAEDVRFSILVKSFLSKDSEAFFKDMEAMDAKPERVAYSKAASFHWSTKGGPFLAIEICHLINSEIISEKDGLIIWRDWCGNQEAVELLKMVLALPTKIEQAKWNDPPVLALFDSALERAIHLRSVDEKRKMANLVSDMKSATSKLATANCRLAIIIAKWIAVFLAPELIPTDSIWYVGADGKFAVSKSFMKPARAAEIFSLLSKRAPTFCLPNLAELRFRESGPARPEDWQGHRELVRDKLPDEFNYKERVPAASLQTIDHRNGMTGFVDHSEYDTVVLNWRVRLNLDLLSPT